MVLLPWWARSERAVEVDGDRFRGAPLEGLRSSGRRGCGDTMCDLGGGLGLDREFGMALLSGILPCTWLTFEGTAAKRWSCGHPKKSMKHWHTGTVKYWGCHLKFLAFFEVCPFELRKSILCVVGVSRGGVLEIFLDTLSCAILRFLLDSL
jgi:hypothetical protein